MRFSVKTLNGKSLRFLLRSIELEDDNSDDTVPHMHCLPFLLTLASVERNVWFEWL